MKISFDVDDTLTRFPNELKSFAQFMKVLGHEVGILSSRLPENCPKKEDGWDFVIGFSGESSTITGKPFTTVEEIHRDWKAEMIKNHAIDIHFDDMADLIQTGDIGGAKIIKI